MKGYVNWIADVAYLRTNNDLLFFIKLWKLKKHG